MKVTVIGGTGYVGLCSGVGLAMKGHDVILVGRSEEKAEMVNRGESPIYEPGLDEKLKQALEKGKVKATTDLEGSLKDSQISLICVGTPSKGDGSIDLGAIKTVARDVGKILKDMDSYHVVVVKSTVVPETTEKEVIPLLEENSGKKAGKDFGVGMNPEFLREGKALDDFLEPDRIVIGELDGKSGDVLEKLYQNFDAPIMRTDLKTAEMIKYVSNSMLATKISFANEIGNLCKKLGIDTYEVMKGVGLDKRIGPHFLNSGIGWGGSCFPKDVAALIAKAREMGHKTKILDSVTEVNEDQPMRFVQMLKDKMPKLDGKTIAVLGLAFKPDTDDIRETRAVPVVRELLKEGAEIKAYDPQAIDNFKKKFPEIAYVSSPREALENSDACLILTHWDEFKQLTGEDFSVMNQQIILEGRKTLHPDKVSDFEGICW